MPAGMQAGDAGGFLQQRAALIRPRIHQRADSALADHRRGAGAGGEVREQRLHIARPGFLAVHPVGAARSAFDFAGNFEVGRLVEGRRGEARRFLQREGHLRQIARGAPGRAGENHILHLGAAHVAGIGLAHCPAQRLDDIGFAAPVRPDHAGQAWQDLDRGGIREAFEAGNAQAGETGGQILRSLSCGGLGDHGGEIVVFHGARISCR